MNGLLIVGLLALNFAISWFNCWSVGGIWAESKAVGGFPRVLAWCGAIQSAIGFSSVIGAILLWLVYLSGHLPPRVADGAISLWYLLVIFPAISTGLIITIQSWIQFARERSLGNLGVAAYNTYAQVHNMYGAVDGIGDAISGVGKLFGGGSKDSDSDNDNAGAALAIIIVAVALLGGVLLTAVLIRMYAGRLPKAAGPGWY